MTTRNHLAPVAQSGQSIGLLFRWPQVRILPGVQKIWIPQLLYGTLILRYGICKRRIPYIGTGLRIPVSEIVWRFNPSGGPGGQHANKASTRVEAELNLGRLELNEETKSSHK